MIRGDFQAVIKQRAYSGDGKSVSFHLCKLRSEFFNKELKSFSRLGLGEAFWLVAPGILIFFEIARYLIYLYLSSSGFSEDMQLLSSAVLRVIGTTGSAAVIWINAFNTKYKYLSYVARVIAVLEMLFLFYILYKTGEYIFVSGVLDSKDCFI